jgi:hypothetical protein
LDSDDDRSQLPEGEQEKLQEAAFAAATAAATGDSARADSTREKELLFQMERVAEVSRGLPDARVRYLIDWIHVNMCPGAHHPGEDCAKLGAKWADLRILIFTEYDDTRRYLVEMLRAAISETDLAEHRIDIFHGPTPLEKREAIKRAFNLPPTEDPLRILVATDAAREGLNLQGHCWNLFHFDLPWNPSRLEQRNGRIDRKLQPRPKVFCHYFVYEQRPEDEVLKALARKTETIRSELGSLAQVLEGRLADTMRGGIRRRDITRLKREIEEAGLDPDKRASANEELEATRERQDALRRQIDGLRTRISDAQKWIGLDADALRDAISSSLEILGAEQLKPVNAPPNTPPRFAFPNLEARYGADPTWSATLDTLRALPEDGRRTFQWRKNSPIRPVIFSAPEGIDEDVVQLHLQHRVVQRLLGRFISQGFVHRDLSRACLAQSTDAIPRVILLGRLSLYGSGAVRLHEEILTVTARWSDPSIRKGGLTPYGHDAEAKTIELLEDSLRPTPGGRVSEQVQRRLLDSIPRDIEDLLPYLEERGEAAKNAAEAHLAERARAESDSMRHILEEQRRRVAEQLGRAAQLILDLGGEDERRQFESNRRYWQRWLENVEGEIDREPDRIMKFYSVASFRIEPIGLAYLWPVTG